MLLCGDARGDHVLEGLETAGLLAPAARSRSTSSSSPTTARSATSSADFFERLPARHYVISANGRDGNPETATLEAIAASRADDDFTIHLTNHDGKDDLAARLDAFVAARDAAGRRYGDRVPRPGGAGAAHRPGRPTGGVMSPLEDLQARADALLTRTDDTATVEAKIASTEGPSRRFSAFIPSELDRALALASELMRIADAEGGEAGVAAALAEAERRADVEDVQLVRHAVELFIVHDPEAARLAIPPIPPAGGEARGAQLAGRDRARGGARLVPRGPARQRPPPPLAHRLPRARPARPRRRAAPGPPGRAVLLHAPADARALRRRAARRSGSAPVVPFADYREPIGEGYEDRPSGQALRDVDRQDTGLLQPRRARGAARPPARRGRPRARRRTAPGRAR